jgi:ATP-dependent HslUV protease subunit HslV
MGNGQVSMGSMPVKPNAKKIHWIPSKEGSKNLICFAGSTANAFTLLERLEGKLEEYPGQLAWSCVELAKGWRTDKYLHCLEASLLVADETVSLELTGNGDVLESSDGVLGAGSGSLYALTAASALMDLLDLTNCRTGGQKGNEYCIQHVCLRKQGLLVKWMNTKEKDKDEK